jgi:PTH2 family peptidyl-tRNA hydrolase
MSSLPLNTILVVTILSTASLSIGYHLGARHSRPLSNLNANGVQDAEDDDEPDITDGDLSAVKVGLMEPCKMARPQHISVLLRMVFSYAFNLKVLVVRTDLKLTPGQISAQWVMKCHFVFLY